MVPNHHIALVPKARHVLVQKHNKHSCSNTHIVLLLTQCIVFAQAWGIGFVQGQDICVAQEHDILLGNNKVVHVQTTSCILKLKPTFKPPIPIWIQCPLSSHILYVAYARFFRLTFWPRFYHPRNFQINQLEKKTSRGIGTGFLNRMSMCDLLA